MTKAFIISATKIVDGVGCHQDSFNLEAKIREFNLTIVELVVDPLSTDWHSPEQENHYRSGCAPIEALAKAKSLIEEGNVAALIKGTDLLRSGYTRQERLSGMSIYGDSYPLTEAYNDLSLHFVQNTHCSAQQFRYIAEALFENYVRSFKKTLGDNFTSDLLPAERWYQPITSLFRGVDCANPLIDFSGRVLVCSEKLADKLNIANENRVEVSAVGLGRADGDGKDYITQLSGYQHLKSAFDSCCSQVNMNLADLIHKKETLLELYTCYPVVPMAFLLVNRLVTTLDQIPDFLERYDITISGGMNLARAPWNNPALNSLITMYHALIDGAKRYGVVHGNGGLGYRQGVALLAQNGE